MSDRQAAVARSCFAGLIAVGLGLLLIGVVIEPIMPAFALDRVLTPEELADPGKRDATMALLRRAEGNRWLFWSLAGVVVVAISSVGLWATRSSISPDIDA